MLTECACGREVPPTAIDRVVRSKGAVVLRWTHECGRSGAERLSWGEYRRLVEDYASAKHLEPPQDRGFDPELVGRTVQGFRIDLDAVSTVADIQLLWNDQERWALHTVPREG